ncbi:MAG: discoidin domain-containing protein [Verrucomicrobiae bacterium]|nr:discoidin domain-containing protein [Verrucomicrobiae bacterium]
MTRLLTLFFAVTLTSLALGGDALIEFEQGDHIAIVGGGLADRLQHSTKFEAILYKHRPQYDLVVRNLAVTGDEVTTWHRSENFGSQDDWLKRVEADVIFAFWGFNESFKGPDGVEQFKADLAAWIDAKRAQTYGRQAPRIVLFSPIAVEDTGNPDLPDPGPLNENLALYTAAIEAVAGAKNAPFVNLFDLSSELFASEDTQMTVNGLHLTEEGYDALAQAMAWRLLGSGLPKVGDLLQLAVAEKNRVWFSRYRTVDGYNVYGGRSRGVYEGVSNFEVMQGEMTQRDVMTANREKRIWAIVKNGDIPVTDDNLPEVTDVPTNLPDSRIAPYPDPEEAIAMMKVHSGMEVNLFASEKEFPELANPVQMAWDTKNRLWVAAWPTYPEATPTDKVLDKLLIFEDTDHDGKADKMKVFADGLNSPTGFQFYKDGVLVMQAPDVWFLRDTDGDDRADWMQRVLGGIDSADTHHTTNAMSYDPGGGIYLSDGVFHRTQVETAEGPKRNFDGSIYRFFPRTGEFDWYMPHGFANPHGKAFDRWGNDFITDATGNANYFGSAASGHTDNGRKHANLREFWQRPSRPCPATEILSSAHFPAEFQGNFLNANVISFQGIFRVGVHYDGSGPTGETLEHLIYTDPKDNQHFRPICMSNGPDGALYFCDWSQTIIGHLQHHIRDPYRDHQHGRIYRITYKGRDLAEPPMISGQPIEHLIELLGSPVNGTRMLAKIELDTYPTDAVVQAVADRLKVLHASKNAGEALEHEKMELLWVHQWHNVVNEELLNEMLASPTHEARAAAGRVLCYWRKRVSDPIAKMRALCDDANGRVRLEGIRMASFYEGEEAIAAANAALLSRAHPSDYYLDYILKETMQQLEPWWRPALVEGKIAADNPAGAAYLLDTVNDRELLAMPRIPAVLNAWLTRANIPELKRLEALTALSESSEKTASETLVHTLESGAITDPSASADLGRLLTRQPTDELKTLRTRLVKLSEANSGAHSAALAAIMLADGSIGAVLDQTKSDPAKLIATLEAIPWIADPALRATAHDEIARIVTTLPESIAEKLGDPNVSNGRFVRISLPRSGILTLAEVQAFSGGQNIAPQGKASQSSVGSGGVPERAIDGNTSGTYGNNSATHTTEPDPNPWWELDLGQTRAIDSIVIWNRTENNGAFVKRLDGFDLEVLDETRRVVFEARHQPAPAESATIEVGGDPAADIQRAAIRALVSTGQKPASVFAQLSTLLEKGENLTEAARAIRKIRRDFWQPESAGKAAVAMFNWAKGVPAEARTAQDFIENVQVAIELASLLPTDESARISKALRDLGVNVTVIRTVHEQLRYDTTRIVVAAGKPFEIVFENDDVMPHNLVVCQSGARLELGAAALTMTPDQLDAQGRAYVPDSDKIIAASPTLEPGKSARLPMQPLKAGKYEFVCTFPGHYTVMWGELIVEQE